MPSFKLTYFNGRGRAELTRLILAAKGVEYVDERLTEWPKGKEDSPLGQLPYLTVDGMKLPQSASIARYVAKEVGLAGQTNLAQAQADAIVDCLIEVQNIFYSDVAFNKTDKAQAVQKFLEKTVSPNFEKIEKLVKMYGAPHGFSVGSSLTWADLFIYEMSNNILELDATACDKFVDITRIRKLVETTPSIAQYISKRAKTGF